MIDPRPHATDYGAAQHVSSPNWKAIRVLLLVVLILFLVWRCAA